ncbi:LacI family DNA-binding transcriptional regulator [Jiangella mangrovi]|uniref:LacI family transcriptional regulator n=1 Tax=Jiangella mangrovi TaxID=1524084 RepID=A0A7W9GRZ5_9ACTN|nr:LacI family DNA-binding transcriptional regulator [Jiangella mangrovi]MBB5788738.1 LacI family transcriptional regulator [Jiangella mangrovi]
MAKVRVREVAALAGVSTATVSNYLNRPGRVSDETGRRIRAAIDELGYVRNNAARQLRQGRSSTIAHIVPDMTNVTLGALADGIEKRASEAGLSVFLANSQGDQEKENAYLELFEEHGVRGILVLSRGPVEERLAAMRERGTPSVIIGHRASNPEQPSVSVDNVAGGHLAAKHLVDIGRRHIAFVGGPLAIPQVADRLAGAGRAVKESGTASLELITVDQRDVATGRAVGAELAARSADRRPDAVFAVNDLLAVGLEQALVTGGVRVPDDIALVGYDDSEYARALLVPLTSIRPPHESFGASAVDLLITLMTDDGPPEETQLVFAPELVVRGSTVPGADT